MGNLGEAIIVLMIKMSHNYLFSLFSFKNYPKITGFSYLNLVESPDISVIWYPNIDEGQDFPVCSYILS